MVHRCSTPLPDKPDHPALELEILEAWEREGTFAKLRERNRGGPTWSFIDGPVTANRMSLAVHTAWGRTLKDVFQRYKALRGFDQRYQNGFDCQGLWIEVGVERSLGLNSKREIEAFGLEEFARRCREVVVQSSEALTRGSIRLGQWMDWGRDYFTFSDTNIEYIWKFLKIVHEPRLALPRPPGDRVVPALRHVAFPARADAVGRLPGAHRPVALRALPAARRGARGRVRRRLDDDAVDAAGERRRGRASGGRVRAARERRVGPRRPLPRRDVRPPGARRRAGRPSLRGAVRHAAARGIRRASSRAVGRGVARGRHGHRPHRDRLRPGGLRARQVARPAGADADRRDRAASTTSTAGCTACRRSRPPTRSSATSPSGASSSRPAPTPTTTRTAGAATRRSSTGSPTTGSSPSRRCVRSCSRRTRRSSGCPSTWASAWTTGCTTWATGTSRAGATTACRCRSTRAPAGS